MFRVHKTHDEWLVMSGDRTVCRCDFREDAEAIVSIKEDQERLEWLAKAEVFPMNTKEGWCLSGDGVTCWAKTNHSWRDAIDEAMEDE